METGRIGSSHVCSAIVIALTISLVPTVRAQQPASQRSHRVIIGGIVLNANRLPVGDAVVRLRQKNSSWTLKTRTDGSGIFHLSFLPSGPTSGGYWLTAQSLGAQSPAVAIDTSHVSGLEGIKLILGKSSPADQAMAFSDHPDFTIAGATNWMAVGGHGSDAVLRTSESLASATATLKPETATLHPSVAAGNPPNASETARQRKALEHSLLAALARTPESFTANEQLGELYLHAGRCAAAIPLLEHAYRIDPASQANHIALVSAYRGAGDLAQARAHVHEFLATQKSAELYRLAGELDESADDPLDAVHEYAQAVRLSPSEPNYFVWGSELLLHRAILQAQEVFREGVAAHPDSVRMETALGTALFAGARYDDAALHLCQASEMDPSDLNPYLFMGKIQMAAPKPSPCVASSLERFVQQQPHNADANYLYAMSLLKSDEQTPDKRTEQQAEAYLKKTIALDARYGGAYLQLGILSAQGSSFAEAIAYYKKAIAADSQLTDAYYRLAVAYDRTGQRAKAKQEFQLHGQIMQQQQAAVDSQRRKIKQFMVVQNGLAGPWVQ